MRHHGAMHIEVLVDGHLALTTHQAAEQHGYTLAGMRATLRQAGVRPIAKLDERTPLYDPGALAAARLLSRSRLGLPLDVRDAITSAIGERECDVKAHAPPFQHFPVAGKA